MRGKLMQQAADSIDGGMAAILGLEDSVIEQTSLREGDLRRGPSGKLQLPGSALVIAGEKAALAEAIENCKAAGARRALRYRYRCIPYPAGKGCRQGCAPAVLRTLPSPHRRWIFTPTSTARFDCSDLPAHLEQHMISPVRWTQLVKNGMAAGLTSACEIGPGKTLTGFAGKIGKGADLQDRAGYGGRRSRLPLGDAVPWLPGSFSPGTASDNPLSSARRTSSEHVSRGGGIKVRYTPDFAVSECGALRCAPVLPVSALQKCGRSCKKRARRLGLALLWAVNPLYPRKPKCSRRGCRAFSGSVRYRRTALAGLVLFCRTHGRSSPMRQRMPTWLPMNDTAGTISLQERKRHADRRYVNARGNRRSGGMVMEQDGFMTLSSSSFYATRAPCLRQ